MKIIELLFEVFDRNVDGKIIRSSKDVFITESVINGRKIKFTAALFGDVWYVDFIERSNGNMTYNKSGNGGELEVFSFVIQSIKLFIEKYSPSIIKFDSDKSDGNRTSLYRRMANRMSIPGYTYNIDSTNSHQDTFTITRDK